MSLRSGLMLATLLLVPGCQLQSNIRLPSLELGSKEAEAKSVAPSEVRTAQAQTQQARPSAAAPSAAPAAPAEKKSKLAGLDRNALVEVAVGELLGKGYGVETSQPDPSEAPVTKPVMALDYDDQVHLVEQVFGPIRQDAEKWRTLNKAKCTFELRTRGIQWDKTVGEALDANKCERLESRDVYTVPDVNLAFAELLLEGHPQRDELLGQVLVHLADTRGATPRQICYRTEQRPEPTPAVDKPCSEPWARSSWNGRFDMVSTVAYFTPPMAASDMRPMDLQEALFFLKKAPAGSPVAAQVDAKRAELEKLLGPRTAKRDALVKKMRAKNPKVIPMADVLPKFPTSYLWHETCGEPTVQKRWQGNQLLKVQQLCVKVALELNRGCQVGQYLFEKPEGAKNWQFFGGSPGPQDIACP